MRESGSFDVPEDIRGMISRQADLHAMPDWGGSVRRLAAPLRFDRMTVGGSQAQVQFAGLTPGFVGLVQINIRLPVVLPSGSSLPLVVAFGSRTSPAVNLSVR